MSSKNLIDAPRGREYSRAYLSHRSVFVSACAIFASHFVLPSGVSAAPVQKAASAKKAAPRPVAAKSTAVGAEYLLGAADVISVVVQRHPEMSAESVSVTSSGRVQLPVVGAVSVAGKTIEQTQRELTRRLRTRLLRPEVTVSLRQARPRQVFVLGAVIKPGVTDLRPGWRVSDILTASGGLSTRPELTGATLTRLRQKPVALDLQKILSNNNDRANLVLQNGDTLRLVDRSIRISLSGQVRTPGILPVAPGTDLVSALAQAGGTLPGAALSKVTVQHSDGTSEAVNLYRSIVLGQKDNEVKVREGDLITVPELTDRVTVLGAVARQGNFLIPDGTTIRVSEALAQAGGPLNSAALTRATLQRSDGTSQNLNLYPIVRQGQSQLDIPLQSGDIITVPQALGITVLGAVNKPDKYFLEAGSSPRIFDILALAGGLAVPAEKARITRTNTNTTLASANTGAGGASLQTADASTRAGETRSIDPITLLNQSDLSQNEPVYDGDILTVSVAPIQTVYLSGEVKQPGRYEIQEGEGIAQVLLRAGGTSDFAALSRVSLAKRDGTTEVLDVFSLLASGNPQMGAPLREGDFINIPRIVAQVTVVNAVVRPGPVPIPEKGVLTIGDALNKVGGVRGQFVRNVYVFRRTAKGVERTSVAIDRVVKGKLGLDSTLQPGDIVYVPDGRPPRYLLDKVTRGIGSFGVLGAIL